jgi:hypothetical protein
MGKFYNTKKEACAKCRSGEETQIDKKTGKYHNVRSSLKKTNKRLLGTGDMVTRDWGKRPTK